MRFSIHPVFFHGVVSMKLDANNHLCRRFSVPQNAIGGGPVGWRLYGKEPFFEKRRCRE
jgi:hypothetical protein